MSSGYYQQIEGKNYIKRSKQLSGLGDGCKEGGFALAQFTQTDIHIRINKIIDIMILPGIIKCKDKMACSLNGGKFGYLRGGRSSVIRVAA